MRQSLVRPHMPAARAQTHNTKQAMPFAPVRAWRWRAVAGPVRAHTHHNCIVVQVRGRGATRHSRLFTSVALAAHDSLDARDLGARLVESGHPIRTYAT